MAIAMRGHPSLASAQANIKGAEFDLLRAQTGRRPTLTLNGSIDYTNNATTDGTSATVSLSGNLPIYSGGELSSLVRQAQSIVDRRKAELQNAARTVQQDVALSWANLNVARASIRASRQEIRAAGLASLADLAEDFGETWVSAPDSERSGASHAFTLRTHLRIEEVASRRFRRVSMKRLTPWV